MGSASSQVSPIPSHDAAEPASSVVNRLRCADEMLWVRTKNGSVCVDRWEASLIDRTTQTALSPYYPPVRDLALRLETIWQQRRWQAGSASAKQLPVPLLPDWQRYHEVEPLAVSKPDVVPNGYLSGTIAAQACRNAGKRLCLYEEWRAACGGERQQRFPYGAHYIAGMCNIFRVLHPALVLHGNASEGHLDPRLNLVAEADDPLLRPTAATFGCKSVFGDEALWDMNGNLDEWVDDVHGRFVGGFFSRGKKDGCQSSVSAHPNEYFDYSTGVRCCVDAHEH